MKLKTLSVIVMIIVLMFSMSVTAQIKPYDFTVTTGESALSSGLDLSASFANQDFSTIISMQYNAGMGQVAYIKKVSTGIALGPSLGIKDNTMWLAPFLSFDLFGFVKLISWNGVFFW